MTRAKVVAAIKAAGCDCEITVNWRGWSIVIDAPEGKWLRSSGCGVDCSVWGHGRPDWRLALREVEAIIGAGFTDAVEDEDEVAA